MCKTEEMGEGVDTEEGEEECTQPNVTDHQCCMYLEFNQDVKSWR